MHYQSDSAMSQQQQPPPYQHPSTYATPANPQQQAVQYSTPADAAAYQQWLNEQIYNRARSSSINYGHVQPAAPQLYLPSAPAPIQYTTLGSSTSTILPASIMQTPTNAAATMPASSTAYLFSPPNQPSSYWLPEHLRAVQQHQHDTAQQQYSYTAPTTVQNPYSAYFMQQQPAAEQQPSGLSSVNRKRSSTAYASGQQQQYYATQPNTPATLTSAQPYMTLQTSAPMYNRPTAGHVDRRLSAPPASSASPSAHLIALPPTLYPHSHTALPTPSGGQPITSSDATTLLMANCLTTYESGITMRICTYGNCGKKFDKPSALRRHLRTHTGEKPFACPYEGCTMTFSERGNAKRHEKTHTGEKNYPCLYAKCNERFGRRQHQMYHMQSKHMLSEQQIQELEQRYQPATAHGINTDPAALDAPPSVASGEYAASTSGSSTPVVEVATPSTSSSSTYPYPTSTRHHALSVPSATSASSSSSSSSHLMSPQSRPHLVVNPSMQLQGRYNRRTHPQPLLSMSSSGQSSRYQLTSLSGYENTPSELMSSTNSASSTSNIGSASDSTAPYRRQSEVVLSHNRQRSLNMDAPSSTSSRMQSTPPSTIQAQYVTESERMTSYNETDKDASAFDVGGETKRRRTLTEDDMALLRRMQLSARNQQSSAPASTQLTAMPAMTSPAATMSDTYYSRPSITQEVVPEGDETQDNSGRSGKESPSDVVSEKAASADVPITYETQTSIEPVSPKREDSDSLVRPPALRITPEPNTMMSPLQSNKSLPFLVSPFAQHPSMTSTQNTPSSLFQTVSAFFSRRAGSTQPGAGSATAAVVSSSPDASASQQAQSPQ